MITSSARHPTHRRIRKSLNLIVALWLLIAGNASVLAEAAAETKPSFLVIVADDLGYGDLGCYGAEDIATPHLDRMAKEGTKFTSFYVEAVCSPTRAALMTGSHGRRVGIGGVLFNVVIEVPADQALFTRRYTEEAIPLLTDFKKRDTPFLLYLAHNMPHSPLLVHPGLAGRAGEGSTAT